MLEEREEYDPKSDPEVIEFKLIIRAILITVIVMILVSTLWTIFISFGRGNLETSQTSDIEYTFTDNIMLEDSSISFSKENSANLEYFANYSQNYKATYSFTNDDDYSNPVGWVINDETGGSINVFPSFNEHDKVLELNDTNGNQLILSNNVNDITYGTIELLIYTNDATNDFNMQFSHGGYLGTNIFKIWIGDDTLKYRGIGWQSTGIIINDNTWYHLRIDIELTSGGYMDLPQYKADMYIDGIQILSEGSVASNEHHIDNIFLSTGGIDSNFKYYIDAIGYSWGIDTYTGEHFDIASESHSPVSMTSDGNDLWILDSENKEVWEYTTEGVYTGEHFDINNEIEWPGALTFDGIYFWVSDHDSREVYQYTSEGVYTGFFFNINPTVYSAYGITEDGEYLWILCLTKDKVFKYTFEGVYTGYSWDYSSETEYGYDITFYNNEFIILDGINDKIYVYDSDGVYTGGNADLSQVIAPDAITAIDGFIYVADDPLDEVFIYGDNLFYSIGGNIIPNYEIIGLEVYRDEFAFGYDGVLNEIGAEKQVNGWYRQDPYTDQVKIASSNESYDRSYGMFCDSVTNRVLSKIYGIDSTNINVTIGIDYLDMNNADSDYLFTLTGYTDIVLAYFQFIYSGGNILFQWKDSGSSWNTLKTLDPDPNLYREINIHYGEAEDLRVIYKTNDSVYETYYIEKYQSVAKGLGVVSLYGKCDDSSGDQYIKLDYVGAYASINWGKSYPIYGKESFGDFGLYYHSINESAWNTDYHNLIFIKGTGVFGVGIFYGSNLFNSLIGLNNYSISSDVSNVIYKDEIYNYPDIVFIANETFIVSSIKIKGVLLVEGINEYNLEYSSENIDWNENYFYVENNYLKYQLDTDDDSLEYIQASFDISLQSTINYTLRYGGIKNYINIDVEFKILYQDTTFSPYSIGVFSGVKNVIIPQGQVIESFHFLITDNDNNMNYTTIGYFVSISLVYTIGIDFTIVISDYISILIPILIIAIITITIWQATKKKVGNMLIAPTMVFMSYMTFIMVMIPIWLLFVIIFANGIFLYSKWEDQFSIFSGFATIITGFLSYISLIDFWFFYMTFLIMVGYLIFGNTGSRKINKG